MLFPECLNDSKNLLPFHGEVIYRPALLNPLQRDFFFQSFCKCILWKQDEIKLFGKVILTKRKVAWYGDDFLKYTYSGVTKTALPWTPELIQLKLLVEDYCKVSFNSCLLNYYHNGQEGMAWHSDDEDELEENGTIASVSLGAERKFVFKHRHLLQKVNVVLEDGSLLIMKGDTQKFWLHSLPVSKKIFAPRINLTFRRIGELN
jgi:alkylated DNA repair dioxygenase AlkB